MKLNYDDLPAGFPESERYIGLAVSVSCTDIEGDWIAPVSATTLKECRQELNDRLQECDGEGLVDVEWIAIYKLVEVQEVRTTTTTHKVFPLIE